MHSKTYLKNLMVLFILVSLPALGADVKLELSLPGPEKRWW